MNQYLLPPLVNLIEDFFNDSCLSRVIDLQENHKILYQNVLTGDLYTATYNETTGISTVFSFNTKLCEVIGRFQGQSVQNPYRFLIYNEGKLIEFNVLTTELQQQVWKLPKYSLINDLDHWLAWNEDNSTVIGINNEHYVQVFTGGPYIVERLYEFSRYDQSSHFYLGSSSDKTIILTKHPSTTRYLSRKVYESPRYYMNDSYTIDFIFLNSPDFLTNNIFGIQKQYIFGLNSDENEIIIFHKRPHEKPLEIFKTIKLDETNRFKNNIVLFYNYNEPYLSIQFSEEQKRIFVFMI